MIGPNRRLNQAQVLELPKAGAYLIDLGYPNGSSWRTTVSVTAGESYRLVLRSPRGVRHAATEAGSTSGLFPRVVSSALKSIHLREPDLEIQSLTQSTAVSLQSLREFAAGLKDLSIGIDVLDRVSSADLTYKMHLPSNYVPGFKAGYQRRWLIVSGGGKHQTLVAYPYGWADVDGDAFSLSMRRKSIDGGEATKWSVGLRLMDPVYGALVEHLTRRDVLSGSSISESMRGQATTALYEKDGNPFAAAAAAYLFALGDEPLEYRRQWMANLNTRFDWLPDGAIALGWKLLRQGHRGSDCWGESRELLLQACSRGLPYYTVGLHILVEALTFLSMAEPKDLVIRNVLAAARAADVACVRTEPFTTLQVSRFLGLPAQ